MSVLPKRLRLVVVTDGRGDAARVERVLGAAAAGGLGAVSVREPTLTTREQVALVRALVAELRPRGVLVLVSDRIDVARAADADGVQLGFRGLPLAEARGVAPPPFLLGVSAHEGDDLGRLARDGADWCVLGPVFDTPSKRGWRNPIGLEGLAGAARATDLPVVAIGGIERSNASRVLATGVAGIAVVRAVMDATDPAAAARELVGGP